MCTLEEILVQVIILDRTTTCCGAVPGAVVEAICGLPFGGGTYPFTGAASSFSVSDALAKRPRRGHYAPAGAVLKYWLLKFCVLNPGAQPPASNSRKAGIGMSRMNLQFLRSCLGSLGGMGHRGFVICGI